LLIDSLLTPIVEGTACLNIDTDMCKFESSQEDESRAQLADSSKAYWKPKALSYGSWKIAN